VIQRLIARFGGLPATILKIVVLAVVNAVVLWAIPTMIATEAWIMLGVVVAATVALDYLLLTKRFIPAKYVVVGAFFLIAFQIIPIIFNISIAFTNYSTGNIGTKPDAITTIIRESAIAGDTSISFDMIPARDGTGDLVLILTPQFTAVVDELETVPDPDAEPEVFEFDTETDAEFEFDNEAAGDFSETEDLNIPSDFDPSRAPPTYIGTNVGIDVVPADQVQRDEFGTVTGVNGYVPVPDSDLPAIDEQLFGIEVPGPVGGFIRPQGFATAIEVVPSLAYDAATDSFTSTTGTTYVDNGRGYFANPNNAEDELLPGWRTSVGFENFTRVFSDPQIRDPFFLVFIWTFVFAIASVFLTFALGLGLAITLNKPGMNGQRVYRSILIIPYAIPAFLSLLVWAAILNDDFGALNSVTGWNIPWLFDPTWAKVSVILVNIWLGFPYMFLVSTGALQAIPNELQEAARVDGARAWQVFRLVKLPLLLVALTPLLIASFAFNFNNFNNIYLLTGGGPAMEGSEVAGATDILISYTYKIAFAAGKGNDYGLASAISIFIFIIVGTISAISFSRSKALNEDRT
jgi:arabinogalactan oligomer/maltooligosaccharide transport system permease protein